MYQPAGKALDVAKSGKPSCEAAERAPKLEERERHAEAARLAQRGHALVHVEDARPRRAVVVLGQQRGHAVADKEARVEACAAVTI